MGISRPKKRSTILDLGCGAGRHSIFLAKEGFDVFATDQSKVGVAEAKNRSMNLDLNIQFNVCNATKLDIKNESIDAILSFGVLYYLDQQSFYLALEEIYRVLKPGGKAFIVTRTPNDSRCKSAKHLSGSLYKLDKVNELASSGVETGMIMNFLCKNEIQEIFSQFTDINIGRKSIQKDGFVNDDWLVYLTK